MSAAAAWPVRGLIRACRPGIGERVTVKKSGRVTVVAAG